MIEKVDAQIGELLQSLEPSPYADDTAVVFVSDHGDGVAEHRWNQKSVLFDRCCAVPMIVCPPGYCDQVRIDRQDLSSTALDLLPTMAGIAGINWQADPRLKGRDLLDLTVEPRDAVVVEMTLGVRDEKTGYEGRALYQERYKYLHYHGPGDETWELLYDLDADPGEMRSLTSCPSHADVLSRARSRLMAWCGEHGDAYAAYLQRILLQHGPWSAGLETGTWGESRSALRDSARSVPSMERAHSCTRFTDTDSVVRIRAGMTSHDVTIETPRVTRYRQHHA